MTSIQKKTIDYILLFRCCFSLSLLHWELKGPDWATKMDFSGTIYRRRFHLPRFKVKNTSSLLKGCEILDSYLISNPKSLLKTTLFWDPRSLKSDRNSGDDIDIPVVNRRRNQSWRSIDLSEYKATELSAVSTWRFPRRTHLVKRIIDGDGETGERGSWGAEQRRDFSSTVRFEFRIRESGRNRWTVDIASSRK